MIELKDWTMHIWRQDRRCRSGERAHKTYVYVRKHEQWMREEVRDLQAGLYPADQFRIEINPVAITL